MTVPNNLTVAVWVSRYLCSLHFWSSFLGDSDQARGPMLTSIYLSGFFILLFFFCNHTRNQLTAFLSHFETFVSLLCTFLISKALWTQKHKDNNKWEKRSSICLKVRQQSSKVGASVTSATRRYHIQLPNLFISNRNWIAGRSIASNIIESVERSRKTVIVVSKNFAKSHWCDMEMTMAQHKIFDDKYGGY